MILGGYTATHPAMVAGERGSLAISYRKPIHMSKNHKKSGESPLQLTSGMLEKGLEGLQSYVSKTADTISESRDVEAAESFAHLLTKVAQVASELRKAEAAARKSSEDLTRADVMEWFRTLSDTDADRLLREMTTQRKKGSGLA